MHLALLMISKGNALSCVSMGCTACCSWLQIVVHLPTQAKLELWKQCNLTYNPCVSGANIRLNAYWRIQPTMDTCEKCCCINYALLRWVHSPRCTCCIELKGNFVSYVEKRGSMLLLFMVLPSSPLDVPLHSSKTLHDLKAKVHTSSCLQYILHVGWFLPTKYFSYACHTFIAGYGISWCAEIFLYRHIYKMYHTLKLFSSFVI
jgi:hypothetical protein